MIGYRAVTPRPRVIPRLCGLAALVATGMAGAQLGQAAPVATLPTWSTPAITTLAPGVTHQRLVRPNGQVVQIVRAGPHPRVGMRPVQVGGSPIARGQLTSATAALRDPLGAIAAVNGDFFNYTTGNPSGVLMIDGQLIAEPEASRSALLLRQDGLLDAAILALHGRWQAAPTDGAGRVAVRNFHGINRSPIRGSESILYTTAYGAPTTPTGASRHEVRIRLDADAPLRPGVPISGTVIGSGSGGTTIGAGHMVLTGVGSAGQTVARDLPLGRRITLTPGLITVADQQPLTPDVAAAVGGGPVLVRDGVAITNAGEGLSAGQTGTRTARTAVGQAANGALLLIVAEGPVQGSPGITAAEQAQLAAELGARVAVAMDAGGSTQLALGDRAAVDWGGTPRSLANAVVVSYHGLRLEPLPVRISPNADRVDDTTTAVVRSPQAGVATVRIAPRNRGGGRVLWQGRLEGTSAQVGIDPARMRLADGVYEVSAHLTPDDGSESQTEVRRLIVDRTLGSLAARPAGRGGRARLEVRWRLASRARVTVEIRDSADRPVTTLMRGRTLAAGRHVITWNRRVGRQAATGRQRVVVIAHGRLGRTGLVREVVLSAPTGP